MKIVIINYSSSGLFHHACSLVNSLTRLNKVQAILFITSKKNNLALINQHKKITVLAQDTPHKLIPFLLWCINPNEQFNFRHHIKKFQPDIIHILDVYPIYFLHYHLLKKHQVVFTQHDPLVHTGDPYGTTVKLIQSYLQHISKKVIVHGQTLKKELKKHYKIDNKKISIIHLGDNSILLRYPPQGKKIPRSILFFGRISHYKGLDILLNSLISLAEENISFHLTIAGHGNLKKYHSQLNKITNIKIINKKILDKDVSTYFHQNEIIVLPYREATQSGIISLALSAKIAIIATKVGAFPEILTDGYNSLLIPPNNPSELQAAIKKLLNNKDLRRQLITGGIRTVKKRLNWHVTVKKYYAVYQSIQ